MIPYAVLRAYVTGRDRAGGDPTPRDLQAVASLIGEGMAAGAVGVSTSRTILHTMDNGAVLPGTHASEQELVVLAEAIVSGGGGADVLEVSPASTAFPEPTSFTDDIALLIRVARRTGCTIVFSMLQSNHAPREYRNILAMVEEARASGLRIYPEVGSRPISTLMTFMGKPNPFYALPSYAPLREMPLDERIGHLRSPALREQLLTEIKPHRHGLELLFDDPRFWSRVAPLRTAADYYAAPDQTVQAIADQRGVDPKAVAYDIMLEQAGAGILMYAVCNWADVNREALHKMVTHDTTLVGLGDGGAHLSATIDASQPTTFIADWGRDRGPASRFRMNLEAAVKKLTRDNAVAFGLADRGAVKPSLREDLNIINLGALAVDMPRMVYNLPLGLGRLGQRAAI